MKHLIRTICAAAIAVPLTTMATVSYSAAPPAPTSVTLKAGATGFQLAWKGSNKYTYQVAAGYTEKTMKQGALRKAKSKNSTFWEAGPGQQLCFWVRATSGGGKSNWVRPSPNKCGFTPGMRFPWPKGEKVFLSQAVGDEPHTAGFPEIWDDKAGKVLTLTNPAAQTALDISLNPGIGDPSAISQTAVRTIAWGKVVAVWSQCDLVLMDHSMVPGLKGYYASYVHVTGVKLRPPATVGAGEPLGYATNDVSGCSNQRSDLLHVHLTLIDPHSATEGMYKSLVGKTFCQKYTVVDDGEVTFEGLTTNQNQPFATPC